MNTYVAYQKLTPYWEDCHLASQETAHLFQNLKTD
jgi:hypothetical protein